MALLIWSMLGNKPLGNMILSDPGVALYLRLIPTNGLQQKNTAVFEASVCHLHEGSVILVTHMFEHPY